MTRVTANSSITREHSLTGEKLSLLAVFAHPEDESFGPAGTLAMYASEGVEVTLATATRETRWERGDASALSFMDRAVGGRDRLCSCRTTGIRRACLLDSHPGELDKLDPQIIEEKLVRLIREIQPQVVITFGPQGIAGDRDHRIISSTVAAAYHDAGDPTKFPHHFREGMGSYAPQKLYYCVLPQSLVSHWGMDGLYAVPDDQITAVLDVSSYGEAMKNALYCQRSHMLDFIRGLEDRHVHWDSEYYALVESRLNKKPRREKDLFAGLR